MGAELLLLPPGGNVPLNSRANGSATETPSTWATVSDSVNSSGSFRPRRAVQQGGSALDYRTALEQPLLRANGRK